ncbi:MAG: hypothetical protein HYV63_17035 [Candidatus Schekmanbacteria bacterium]|nr:hypothetical protein [Candidatus Schekmanbacteria bacterium]
MLDSDEEPLSQRFDGFAALLAESGYPCPDGLDTVATSGNRRAGVYALPGLQQPGTLEDLLLPIGERRFPALHQHAQNFVKDWQPCAPASHADHKELSKPAGPKKARLSAMVALLKPGKPLAASLEDQGWLPVLPESIPALGALTTFLANLLAIAIEDENAEN